MFVVAAAAIVVGIVNRGTTRLPIMLSSVWIGGCKGRCGIQDAGQYENGRCHCFFLCTNLSESGCKCADICQGSYTCAVADGLQLKD